MTGTATATHTADQTGPAGRLSARPVLAPRPHTPPGATVHRRCLDEQGTSCAPTSIAAVLTVAVSDTTTLAYDVWTEDTHIRLGETGDLRVTIDDRALVRLAVLLNDAAGALTAARSRPPIDTREQSGNEPHAVPAARAGAVSPLADFQERSDVDVGPQQPQAHDDHDEDDHRA